MKRRNKLGGPEGVVELLDFKKEDPSIWPSVRIRTVALTRFRKISQGVTKKYDSLGSSDKREDVRNEEHKTMIVNTMAEFVPTTTARHLA